MIFRERYLGRFWVALNGYGEIGGLSFLWHALSISYARLTANWCDRRVFPCDLFALSLDLSSLAKFFSARFLSKSRAPFAIRLVCRSRYRPQICKLDVHIKDSSSIAVFTNFWTVLYISYDAISWQILANGRSNQLKPHGRRNQKRGVLVYNSP